MTEPLPDGAFKRAVRKRGVAGVQMILGVYAVWLAVLLIPWERMSEHNGAPPLALKGFAALTSGDGLPGGWVAMAVIHALITVCALYFLWRSIVTIAAPHQSSVVGALREWGDPYALIASFEAEATSPQFALEKPLVVATPSWLLVNNGVEVLLVPKSEVVWVYGEKDKTGDVVESVVFRAGGLSSRQRQLARMLPEMDLVVWMRSRPEALTISVAHSINPVLKHFVEDAPHVVVGHSDELEAIWKADREEFLRRSRAHGDTEARA